MNTPEQRVNAYITHWYKQWSKVQDEMGDNVDFDYWGALIAEVDDLHFVEGSDSGTSRSFGFKADFDPHLAKITECEIQGESAQVFTETYDETLKTTDYHVWELTFNAEQGWRISTILELLRPPKSLAINPKEHVSILAMSHPDAPFLAREDHIDLNENTLFQNDRKINIPNMLSAQSKGLTVLKELGRLQVATGVLGILDFAYDIYNFQPLHRKVKAGNYPVQAVMIYNRVAGVRIRFNPQEQPVKWYAANTAKGNGVYGVDAGNLAIFDVNSLLKLRCLQKEQIFTDWCNLAQPQLVSLAVTNDCLITPSGFGDGAYPAFWGVNAKDEIVSLYIDFMILVEENKDGLYQSI
ncbi:DUF4241 domain-containing protein [Pseudomonas sp. F1_0610]|uniref:DUF4241 domain-containing protein n=1 Tax=Pseudomonas sp. F1_0610 TaxID=3114284 RepID=UPI0039C30A8E